ncbi:MAG: hypothetical protein A3C11_01200 [Candidatus Sungbacteria bacterium RIFCSPHIGHO2_02_FULL_49_12]|uniref:Uncharacterized protein n=1 Tax=Candidatus Sungbacteria bacterium RIFCSPHIGHO2_02_FULL_49_12 TaxID=1802271 RepID=A0A1G2KLK9_9BACT|nr:MAG: hypothetical protein A3C11_01200 [Candidatus Sungbacteria bacterium RIFCSPHIGHO2_02_FULL_49_12]
MFTIDGYIKKSAIGGFIGGILFAVAHSYFNIRYDLPLYYILRGLDGIVTCTGSGCRPYFFLAVILSAIVWSLIIVLIARLIQRNSSEHSTPTENPQTPPQLPDNT